MGTYHCPGVGDEPGKLGLSSTKGWEPASYSDGPWGPTITHTGGLLHPPVSAASPTGGQSLAAGNSQPPSRGRLQGHLVSRFRRAEASPICTPTCGMWFCLRPKRNSYPADRLPQRTKSTVGSLTPHTVVFSPKLHGLEIENSKPYSIWFGSQICHLTRCVIFGNLFLNLSVPQFLHR